MTSSGTLIKTEAKPVDARDAFFDALFEIAAADRNVVLLTDDMGAFSLERFRKELSGQYINMGIAEQNLVAVAAGLALRGKIPFLYGIATFMTMRCFEQIKVNLCCMKLPVSIIASGAGYTYGSDGPTHHATQDVAIMRTLPEMSIYNPTDITLTSAVVRIAHWGNGPNYIRIEKGVLPKIYEDRADFSRGFGVLRSGQDVAVISTGLMVHECLKVVDDLRKHSIDAGLIDLYRVKPVNEKALVPELLHYRRIVTVEENSAVGGIGSLICEMLADADIQMPVKRLALPDRHVYDYGNRAWLQCRSGMDRDSILTGVLKWCEPKRGPFRDL